MKDRYVLLAAYAAFIWGAMRAMDLPEFWDEGTLHAYLISIPCLTIAAFFGKDAINAAKTAARKKECIHG